jgi:hypothetical protein
MNTNTNGRRTSQSLRRAVPAIAIVALAIGLGACQTPPRGAAVPEVAPVVQPAQVPAGVDSSRPADRIAEQLERLAKAPATHFPSWTDRITAQLEYEASLTVKSTDRFKGMSADRVEEQIARENAAKSDEFKGVPADRIVERLGRVVHGMGIQ